MSDNAGSAPKSVAFTSPYKIRKSEEKKADNNSEDGITCMRRESLADSDAENNNGSQQPLFAGLYPVVFLKLKQTTKPRIWCLKIIENPWFERVSMMVILINCVTLGFYEPCTPDSSSRSDSTRRTALEICDHFVFGFFALEMLVKMIAMGVWGKLGYLGDKWNLLDLIIVGSGIVEYAVQMEGNINFTAIRTIRVLRPLRAINRVAIFFPGYALAMFMIALHAYARCLQLHGPMMSNTYQHTNKNDIFGMRILVMLLLDTLPMLGNVLLLCSFVFFIFGIIAVQLWAGLLRQRCFLNDTMFNVSEDEVRLWKHNQNLSLAPYFGQGQEPEPICSNQSDGGMFHCSDRSIIPHYRVGNITCELDVASFAANSTQEIINENGLPACVDWNQYYSSCKPNGKNPFQGAICFDNIMYAWVAIFQVISLEGWVDIMYFVMDAYSFYSFIYFILLIVIGSFFMINLCLVVIATQFSETKQREQKLIEEQRLRFKSNDSTLASYSPPGNTYEEILKYISHLYRKTQRKMTRKWLLWKQNRNRQAKEKRKSSGKQNFHAGKSMKGLKKGKSIHLHHHYHHHHHHHHYHPGGVVLEPGKRLISVGVDVELQGPQSPSLSAPRLMITDGRSDCVDAATNKNQLGLPFPAVSNGSSIRSVTGSITSCHCNSQVGERPKSEELLVETAGEYFLNPGSMQSDKSRNNFVSGTSSPRHFTEYVTSNLNCPCSDYDVADPECFESEAEGVVEVESNSSVSKKGLLKTCFQSTKKKVCKILSDTSEIMHRLVDTKYFNTFIMTAIVLNTASMGIEHHQQPDALTKALDICNIVFTTIFALEMLSKLIGYGIIGYIRNLYNVFDAVIVIISVCEIAADTQDAGGNGLSVLRTFRLLRVLKLVRFLPALQRQLVVLMKTMDNVATFMMLLTLFIFIFSILGMHLFGCKFCLKNKYGMTECDRKNFDSLLWACVTVFQILTQEDWNVVLYNGMDAKGPAAALYFIMLMTVGNYVLFNLLVAILVEGFQAECYSGNSSNQLNGKAKSENGKTNFILAEKYTKRIARSLGLQTSRRNSMQSHDAADNDDYDDTDDVESEESDVEEELRVEKCKKPSNILIIDHETNNTSALSEVTYHAVPIITHTSATPTNSPTPCGSPSPERFPLEEAFRKNQGSESDNTNRSTDAKNPGCEKSLSCSPVSLSPTLQLTTGSPHRQRSCHSESRRSSISSTFSLSGSWKLWKQRGLPLDQQSLVSWEDDECAFEDKVLWRNREVTGSVDPVFHKEKSDKPPFVLNTVNPSTSFESGEVNLDDENNKNKCFNSSMLHSFFRTSMPHCAHVRSDWPLFLIPPQSCFRRAASRLVSRKWFDYIILMFIFANCFTIAAEKPTIKANSPERYRLDVLNYIFTAVFTIELILKVIAWGFYIGQDAYLKSGWNVLDFFLVITSLVDVVMTLATKYGSKLGLLRVFRLLRALRPLRVISRAPGLKLVVQTLISSLKPIGNIVLICCAFFIIFGILGVQIFKGKFYYCAGDDVRNVTNETSCKAKHYEWINRRYNFDHLGQALMSLFVLSSKDGWVEIMYNGIDAVDVGKQPKRNYNPAVLLYFISFLLIVGFFVINMFVGVVVENFHRCREQHELQEMQRKKEARERKEEKLRRKRELRESGMEKRRNTLRRRTLTLARTHVDGMKGSCGRWWDSFTSCCKKGIQNERYYESYGPCRRRIYNICTNKYFELGVAAVIGVNIITMAAEHYGQSKALEDALKYANYVFTGVFVAEAALKLMALGVVGYFRDAWNHMDMLIVILSVVGIIIEDVAYDNSIPINPTIVRFMRVLRIARVLKLLKISKGIRSLLETVLLALPQVGNLGLLFLLLFFIYAALGVELFGTISSPSVMNMLASLVRRMFAIAHGENEFMLLQMIGLIWGMGQALLSSPIGRNASRDGLVKLGRDTLRPMCDDSPECIENCCVNPAIISPLYFVTFVMMAQFVLVNVVIAVLMKQLEESRAESSSEEDEEDDVDDDDDDDSEEDDNEHKEDLNFDNNIKEEECQTLLHKHRRDSYRKSSEEVSVDDQDAALLENKTFVAEVNQSQTVKSMNETDFENKSDKKEGSNDCDHTTTACNLEDENQNISNPLSKSSEVIIIPPQTLSSSKLHVSGCVSTGASPARSLRDGSMSLRTNSLNLPRVDSTQKSSSQLFLGTSNQAHLPLHPCNSDPSKPTSPRYQRQESSGELKLSRTPERHRRIKRHFSDNPMLLRPANQKVFHHHHYHLPVESFSQSTNNLSVSPTGASISMKQKAFSSSVDNTHLNPVSNHESRLSNSDVENSLHSDASQQTDVSSNASQNLSAKESLKHKDVDSGTESCKEQQNSAKETVVRADHKEDDLNRKEILNQKALCNKEEESSKAIWVDFESDS